MSEDPIVPSTELDARRERRILERQLREQAQTLSPTDPLRAALEALADDRTAEADKILDEILAGAAAGYSASNAASRSTG